jgi:membrane-associated protease RseP (regulator of RpoE activity)
LGPLGGPLRWHLGSLLVVWLCAACAGPDAVVPSLTLGDIADEKRRQEIAQLRDYFAELTKFNTVAYRITTANREFCDKWVIPQLGLFAATPASLPSKYRKFSREALGLRWVSATVISLVPDGAAAKAGMKDKDELISFNGWKVPVTAIPRWISAFLEENGERAITIAVKRNDEDMTFTVTPVTGCAIPIYLETNPEANAYTDYSKIVIQSGWLRLTQTEADLAAVVGHELAHNTMGHYRKKQLNGFIGAVGGTVIDGGFLLGGISTGGAFSGYLQTAGMNAFSVGFELEADYIGAYYAARAGYDVSGIEEVWQRLSLENPASIRKASTHPTTPVRYLQMRKVIAEIAEKKAKNLPLLPELKKKPEEPEIAAAHGDLK